MRSVAHRTSCASLLAAVLLASCDDAPRCGTGDFDEIRNACVCPDAADPASSCELPRDRFDTQAHRGARSVIPPGNTIPAFVEAIRLGIDTLEGDLQITADREVILNHDPSLSSECVYVGPGPAPASRVVADLMAAEIALFDCHPDLAGIDPPPSLASVLDLHTRANVGFDLELKVTTIPEVDTAMQALVDYDTVCGHCLGGRLLVQSFDADALRHARAAYATGLGFEFSYLSLFPDADPAGVAQFAEVHAPLYSTVTAEVVLDFHAVGVRIVPWTVDDETAICDLVRIGVDGIISNDPVLLIDTVARCR